MLFIREVKKWVALNFVLWSYNSLLNFLHLPIRSFSYRHLLCESLDIVLVKFKVVCFVFDNICWLLGLLLYMSLWLKFSLNLRLKLRLFILFFLFKYSFFVQIRGQRHHNVVSDSFFIRKVILLNKFGPSIIHSFWRQVTFVCYFVIFSLNFSFLMNSFKVFRNSFLAAWVKNLIF